MDLQNGFVVRGSVTLTTVSARAPRDFIVAYRLC